MTNTSTRIVLSMVCGLFLAGCGGDSANSTSGTNPAASGGAETSVLIVHSPMNEEASSPPTADEKPFIPPADEQIPAGPTALLTIETPEAGYFVLIDGEPVRARLTMKTADAEQDVQVPPMQLAPLSVRVQRGKESRITVGRPGVADQTRVVPILGDLKLAFETFAAADPATSVFKAPLFDLPVGQVWPLENLNSAGREFDPSLSEDGLTVWFAADRKEGRGVYFSQRASPYHDFPAPELVPLSRGSDLPCTPMASPDGLQLVYGLPERARMVALRRTNTKGEFDDRDVLRAADRNDFAWRSVQALADGSRIYWTQESSSGLESFAAVRSESAKGSAFGKTLRFALPGVHPALASDGLRQYLYDGQSVRRATRKSLKDEFGPPMEIARYKPGYFVARPAYRQFWISSDEQWLIYCDDPVESGELFLVRLSPMRAFGPRLWAEPLQKSADAPATDLLAELRADPKKEDAPAMSPAESKDQPAASKPADPFNDPLPYTRFRAEFVKLLIGRNWDAAGTALAAAKTDPAFKGDSPALTWDTAEWNRLVTVRDRLRKAFSEMKAGSVVRINSVKMEFTRFEEDRVTVTSKGKEIQKAIGELTAAEWIAVLEPSLGKDDEAFALEVATLLMFEPNANEKVVKVWLDRAGKLGLEVVEQLAGRKLLQADSELARKNLARAMLFLDEAEKLGPNTSAAVKAQERRNSLFKMVDWKPLGKRKWEQGDLGEYRVESTRSEGSFLLAERKYGNFGLECEWKVQGPTAMGGIYFRYTGRGSPFTNGFKVHLANDKNPKQPDHYATGSLFGNDKPKLSAAKPEGEWNTLAMKVRGEKVQVWINGQFVLDAVARNSKVPLEGQILLDGVAGGMAYRKILIYELKD